MSVRVCETGEVDERVYAAVRGEWRALHGCGRTTARWPDAARTESGASGASRGGEAGGEDELLEAEGAVEGRVWCPSWCTQCLGRAQRRWWSRESETKSRTVEVVR